MTETIAHGNFERPVSPETRVPAFRYLAAVLLLPLLVLWRQDNTLFTGVGYLDPWQNFGFFRNLVEFKRNLFPGSVQGSHLSWILPGAIAHSLFSPVIANCVLHLGVYTVATVSLFLTLQWVVGARRAFLATLLFSVNPWLWFATGWDYGDGAAIAYCLLTIALLTRAARKAPVRRILIVAGMAQAALVYTNLYWVMMAPPLLLYYVLLARTARRVPVLRSFLDACCWFGAGCVLVTVVLGAINYVLDGHFFFYAPAVLAALHSGTPETAWLHDLMRDHAPAACVWSAIVAAATAVVVLASRWRRLADLRSAAAVLLAALFLCAVAWTAFLLLYGIPAGFYCASQLLPFSFLVIGVWFWPSVDTVSARAYVWICVVSAAVFAIGWIDGTGSPLSGIPHPVWVGSASLAASLVWRRRPAGMVFALAIFAILTTGSAAMLYSGLDASAYQRHFESLVQARARIESVRHGHSVRFWYDEKETAAPDAVALSASYIWLPSLLGRSFETPPCDADLAPSTFIASISTDPAHGTEFVASALSACWSGQGLRALPVTVDSIDRRSYVYRLSMLRVEPAPGRWQLVAPVFGGGAQPVLRDATASSGASEFPLRHFALQPGSDGSGGLHAVPQGVQVRTYAQPGSMAALFPVVTATIAGRYRFAMRYWPGAGNFRFGAVARGRADPWLAYARQGYWTGAGYEAAFWMDLAEGEQFQLGLSNNNGGVHRPASFLIKSLSAVRLRN